MTDWITLEMACDATATVNTALECSIQKWQNYTTCTAEQYLAARVEYSNNCPFSKDDIQPCSLCFIYSYKGCRECPLFLVAGKCTLTGSSYRIALKALGKFNVTPSVGNFIEFQLKAQRVLELLLKCRKEKEQHEDTTSL